MDHFFYYKTLRGYKYRTGDGCRIEISRNQKQYKLIPRCSQITY